MPQAWVWTSVQIRPVLQRICHGPGHGDIRVDCSPILGVDSTAANQTAWGPCVRPIWRCQKGMSVQTQCWQSCNCSSWLVKSKTCLTDSLWLAFMQKLSKLRILRSLDLRRQINLVCWESDDCTCWLDMQGRSCKRCSSSYTEPSPWRISECRCRPSGNTPPIPKRQDYTSHWEMKQSHKAFCR